MTNYAHKATGSGKEPRWLGAGKCLFVIVLAILFLLLAKSMVHHRFFRGGVNRNYSVGQ
jgi:hypothetical protein